MSPVWLIIMFGLVFIWLIGLTILILSKKQTSDGYTLPTSDKGLAHWSLIKFNPFSDTGGSHSFVICLLDNLKNGIILTSLHGRGVTRFYAKGIDGGRAEQDLSGEEKKALAKALEA